MATILIVEDDDDVRSQLERDVTVDGHNVIGVPEGAAALEAVARCAPDLIVLDLSLPDADGMQVCRRIREDGMRMPILILSGKSDIGTRVLGLDSGADDYVIKPFSVQELLARIRRHVSRFRSAGPTRESIDMDRSGLRIDIASGRVWRDEAEVELTAKEFETLAFLFQNPDQVISRETLLSKVWHFRSDVTTRAIDTHIANLRRKIERDPANPERILTVHGRGYKYVRKKH